MEFMNWALRWMHAFYSKIYASNASTIFTLMVVLWFFIWLWVLNYWVKRMRLDLNDIIWFAMVLFGFLFSLLMWIAIFVVVYEYLWYQMF